MKQEWIGNILAADIGGTKTILALVAGKGQIADWLREATELTGLDAAIEKPIRMLRVLRDRARNQLIVAIGISIPAVLEHGRDQVICAPNLPGFHNVQLRESLEALNLQIYLEYDGHTTVLADCDLITWR